MDHGVPAYTDCIVDNMYDPYHKNMTIKLRQEYRWVAAPLSIATPPPGQNATALFGCVIMSH